MWRYNITHNTLRLLMSRCQMMSALQEKHNFNGNRASSWNIFKTCCVNKTKNKVALICPLGAHSGWQQMYGKFLRVMFCVTCTEVVVSLTFNCLKILPHDICLFFIRRSKLIGIPALSLPFSWVQLHVVTPGPGRVEPGRAGTERFWPGLARPGPALNVSSTCLILKQIHAIAWYSGCYIHIIILLTSLA